MKRAPEATGDWDVKSADPPDGEHALFAWSVITGFASTAVVVACGLARSADAAVEATEGALFTGGQLGLIRRVPMNSWIRHPDRAIDQMYGIAAFDMPTGTVYWDFPQVEP